MDDQAATTLLYAMFEGNSSGSTFCGTDGPEKTNAGNDDAANTKEWADLTKHKDDKFSDHLDGASGDTFVNEVTDDRNQWDVPDNKGSDNATEGSDNDEDDADTGNDEDYHPSDDDEVDSGSDVNSGTADSGSSDDDNGNGGAVSDNELGNDNENERTKPMRHKRAVEATWKQSIIKEKRLKGESFKNRRGKMIPAKKMGPSCESVHCKRSKLRDCQSLSEEQRKDIFDRFWLIKSWEQRRQYVHTLVNKVEIKQKKSQASRRSTSFSYHLKLSDATSIPVCKQLFSSTLGVSQRTVASWLKDDNTRAPPKPKTPKTGRRVPVGEGDLSFLKTWLTNLPNLPSHYCRNVPAYKNKKFLYPGTTKSGLYEEYQTAAAESGARVVGYKMFSTVFDAENFSVFIPRKDQCDVCVSAKHGNTDQDTYDAHIRAKDEARAEKARDKEMADDKLSVWSMDLQAVLLCPQTKASAMYYKTKLIVHNFTLFNLATKEGFCYAWDETEGTLAADVFAHLQFNHFKKLLEANASIEKIIIWSDGCGYQNRNATVTNAYMHLAMTHGVEIVQKYLVSGHTQMECDSMHSTIERKIVADIFTPRDYIVIFESARLRPSPYHVSQVCHHEMMKLSGSFVNSIRPGKRAGDPTVNQLSALEYSSTGGIRYKLDHSEESDWKVLPQRVTIPPKPFEWVPLFNAPLPIPMKKFKDLQSMKHVMPQSTHHFFDSLPHLEE